MTPTSKQIREMVGRAISAHSRRLRAVKALGGIPHEDVDNGVVELPGPPCQYVLDDLTMHWIHIEYLDFLEEN